MSAGTISECVNEKFADSPLHTAALQFLTTIFTEETKCRNKEVTSSASKPGTKLSDTLNGPTAGELCEMLLRVGEKVKDV